jgi:deoxyribonuclease V
MEGTWQPLEIPDVAAELLRLLDQVPAGRVTTYGALAAALGNPVAARWVGHFLLHHSHQAGCVCHRVVRADGLLGQYAAGPPEVKARRLASEGVEVGEAGVELPRYGFAEFCGGRPLARLQQIQEAMAQRVSYSSPRRKPSLAAGLDVSYPAPDAGVGAYALVELDSGRLVWSMTLRRPVRFPYITSYLTFRELPILLDLIGEAQSAGRLADVFLVDGSGVLHPRHAGLAAHFGVVTGLPTIGLTKKLLCGSVDLAGLRPLESRPVVYQDRVAGAAVRPTAGSRRPVFLSPGNRVSLPFADQVVRRLLTGRRLPEPLYWADRLSRAVGRERVAGGA